MPKISHNPSSPWHGRLAHDGPQAIHSKRCHAARGIGRTSMPRAFTLMEMTVSIVIMIVVMLSVGVIFQSAGRTVGVSQSSMEMFSNVRAIQQQLENDLAGIDKDGFLVIRSVVFTDSNGTQRRGDLMSFISYGSFPHRTGNTSNQPFTDNSTIAPAAFITWNPLALEKSPGANNNPTDPGTYLVPDQTYKVPLRQVPTGIESVPAGLTDGALTLGRNAILLVPNTTGSVNESPGGTSVAAYQNQIGNPLVSAIDYNTSSVSANGTTDSSNAHITQSRVDLAATTPAQIMSFLQQNLTNAGGRQSNPRYEADHFCYRHASLRTPYDSIEKEPMVNGYFRMHPIALQGVTSFAIEWTDGAVFQAGDKNPINGNTVNSGDSVIGTTKWYGLGAAKNGGATLHVIDPSGAVVDPGDGRDSYCAIFSYDTPRALWPVALRFRYHISDPANRLLNGRDFVEVVKLPN